MRPTDRATPGPPPVSRSAAGGTGLGFRVIGPKPLSTSVGMSFAGVADPGTPDPTGVLCAPRSEGVAVAVAGDGTEVVLGGTVGGAVGAGRPTTASVMSSNQAREVSDRPARLASTRARQLRSLAG